MLETSYKLSLLGRNSCREVDFTPNTEDGLRIGTGHGCTIRYRKEYFFNEFYLEFRRSAEGWILCCSEGVHVTRDGVLKLQSLELVHGLSFQVFDCSDMELFKCSFLLDFERTNRAYRTEINLDGIDTLTIGGQAEHIILHDELVGKDTITLTRVDGVWRLSDNGTRYGIAYNGTLISTPVSLCEFDFFSLVSYAFLYKNGKLYTDLLPGCDIHLPIQQLPETNNQFRYPSFNRSTRLQYQVPEDDIEILPPPPKNESQRKSILFSLIPSLTMLALVVFLRGMMGGGGSFVIYSACSMGVGIVMSIATYISDGRRMRRDEKKRKIDYASYIEVKRLKIEQLRSRELEILRNIYTDQEENLNKIQLFDERLFERSPEDVDFLCSYIGSGEICAPNQIKVKPLEFKNGDDPLCELPEQLAEEYRCLPNGPVFAHLKEDNCLGVVGDYEDLNAAFMNITVDLAARHYFHDVKLAYILADEVIEKFPGLHWLPHLQEEDGDLRYLGCDDESRGLVLETIYAILSGREVLAKGADANTPPPTPHIVVFVYGELSLTKHPVSRYFGQASELSCTFLFFAEHKEVLPRGCGEILFLEGTSSGTLVNVMDAAVLQHFAARQLEKKQFQSAIMKLAATKIDEVSLESELTRNISLYELLGIVMAEDLDLKQRWNGSQVFCSMAAPLGVDRKGEPVFLDIGDKSNAHGPHGLIAGTTGSGKSELLQSYILSMSTLFHPYDVSFVIIDFKGGGMSNQFKYLPQLLGSITNIDGREIDRSLLSIKAELIRRQAIFAQTEVNHINDYIKLFKSGKAEMPLPHLIIIVDEFAELKSEFPDFMKELISAARIGRTLGIHLILATQKPSGVVDAQIWSNSRFRLCLKVQNKEDSSEVLKSPLAAEIKEPGRAYFQVGNNEIFELFQSAYGGAPVPDVDLNQNSVHDICMVSPSGKRELVYTNRGNVSNEQRPSQLQSLVDYISHYCEVNRIEKLPGICLPPLPDQLLLSELSRIESKIGVCTAVGLYDDPEQQAQGAFYLNLTGENCFVAGASQMGKSNFLRTMSYSLIEQYSPEEVNLYFIDCGNMTLKNFEQSIHVGGVVLSTEDEKMGNLFKLLNRAVARRRALFAEKGVGTYGDYLDGGFHDLPQIVVLLDNMAAFREYYEGFLDELLVLSREGLSVGISFVITSTQANALSYKAMANFSRRIAFTCTDEGEYGNLFGRTRLSPKPVPGRALVMQDKRVLECHIAQSGTSTREIERAEELRAYLEHRNKECTGSRAEPIPMVPERLLEDDLFRTEPMLFRTPYVLPLGMDYGEVQYVQLDLLRTGVFTLMGSDSSGRLDFLRYLLSAINRTIVFHNTVAYILDDKDRPLRNTEQYGYVEQYTTSTEAAIACLEELKIKLNLRQEHGTDEELLLIVLGDRGLLQGLTTDKAIAQLLLELARKAQECRALLILNGIENVSTAFNSLELLKFLKEQRQGMFFGSLAECRFYDITPKQLRELSQGGKSGECFLMQSGELLRIKAIQQSKGGDAQ